PNRAYASCPVQQPCPTEGRQWPGERVPSLESPCPTAWGHSQAARAGAAAPRPAAVTPPAAGGGPSPRSPSPRASKRRPEGGCLAPGGGASLRVVDAPPAGVPGRGPGGRSAARGLAVRAGVPRLGSRSGAGWVGDPPEGNPGARPSVSHGVTLGQRSGGRAALPLPGSVRGRFSELFAVSCDWRVRSGCRGLSGAPWAKVRVPKGCTYRSWHTARQVFQTEAGQILHDVV